jgi:hypothetical protein
MVSFRIPLIWCLYELTPLVDSDPAEELPAPRPSVAKSTEIAAQPLDPPSTSHPATPDIPSSNQLVSHRKGGRPPNSRKGKLGKNQYTKDKDQDGDGQSPARSQSRDVARGDDSSHSNNKGVANEGKSGKSKGAGNSKVTMSDMKKRVAAILEFISRTQLEMAGGMGPVTEASVQKADKAVRELADSLQGEDMPTIRVNDTADEAKDGEATPTKDFKDLSCVEMMDVLTRQLVKWQREFE